MKNLGMFIILVSIVSLQLKSQDIVVSYKIDKLGVYKFSATNSSQRPYFVVMNFTNLIGNLSEITGTVHRVEPGVKQLCEIRTNPQNMSFTSFSYKYYTSHPSPRTDVDFPYLIPLKDGTKTITIPVVHLNSILNRGTPSNWYCTSFKANQGDTVFASRAGVVVESNASQTVKDVYFNDNENYISILQEDGTLARYSNFDINKVFPYTGERIFAAQPIGIVATNRSENGSYINMTVFHASTEDKEPVCILTKFCASGVKPEILLPNNNYTVHHYPEVITIGMSRKMKKKFLRE